MKVKIVIKSIILIALIIASILQIEKLWFGNNSDHGFFHSIPQRKSQYSAYQELILEPEAVCIYRAKNKGEYRLLDAESILYNSLLKDTGKLMRQLPKMQIMENYLYDDLFHRPHILYRLAFPVSKQLIYQVAEQSSRTDDSFISSMAIIPAELEESRFGILFFDDKAQLVVGFSVPKTDVADENDVFSQYVAGQTSGSEAILLSAKIQGLTDMTDEVLLPSPKQNYILPLEWKTESEFLIHREEQTTIDRAELENYLFSFAKNPKILWSIQDSTESRYGDSSILMSYNTDGVFEYHTIQPVEKHETMSSGQALSIAMEFMNKDNLSAGQEMHLAKTERLKDQIIFYFDYYYRGYRLFWDDALKEHYGVSHPLIITVEGGEVTCYQRVLLKPDNLLEQGSRFQVNYEKVLNRFFQDKESGKIKDLYLGYYIRSGKIKLGWIIETTEKKVCYPLEVEVAANELE